MLQDILTWIIVSACVVIAVTMTVRRFRGKGKACDCGCGSSGEKKSCTPSTDSCSGCAIADLCNHPKKK